MHVPKEHEVAQGDADDASTLASFADAPGHGVVQVLASSTSGRVCFPLESHPAA
jgi:hypothetical protein